MTGTALLYSTGNVAHIHFAGFHHERHSHKPLNRNLPPSQSHVHKQGKASPTVVSMPRQPPLPDDVRIALDDATEDDAALGQTLLVALAASPGSNDTVGGPFQSKASILVPRFELSRTVTGSDRPADTRYKRQSHKHCNHNVLAALLLHQQAPLHFGNPSWDNEPPHPSFEVQYHASFPPIVP
jgi:hypothetical protein